MASLHLTRLGALFFPRRCSCEALLQLPEAARDPAGDRAGRDPELLADRPVALVAAEEAVEHLLALVRELGKRLADGERLVELVEGGVDSLRLGLGRLLACRRGHPVEADAAGHLRDPGPE